MVPGGLLAAPAGGRQRGRCCPTPLYQRVSPPVELPPQHARGFLCLPDRVEQLPAPGAVIWGPEPRSALASRTVQPCRDASICITRGCWSSGDPPADRATRMGDTKPPGQAGKVTVEFVGVRGEQKGSDTLLVLCQPESQGIPLVCSPRRRRGSPIYLGRAAPPSPQTRGEIAVLGRLAMCRSTAAPRSCLA